MDKMDKGKGKGKGNRTNSRRDATVITEYNKRYSEEITGYQKFAAARRNMRTYTQDKLLDIYRDIRDYVEDTTRQGKPLTVAGITLATGTNRDFIRKAKDGEYDYLLEEYLSLHDIDQVEDIGGIPCHVVTDDDGTVTSEIALIPCSQVIEKALLLVQQQLESNCYTNKGNPAGSIFSLKAQFQWREEDNTPQHVVNQLVIADLEQAQKALQMLK